MADGAWKEVHLQVFGCSHQLSQNKFFDPMSRSNREGCDGEVVVEEVKNYSESKLGLSCAKLRSSCLQAYSASD